MNSLNFIKNRSEKQKKMFALIVATIATFVIVGIWYSTSEQKKEILGKEKTSKRLSSVSPFKIIKDEFSKAFSEIGDSVSDLVATDTEPLPVIIDQSMSSSSDLLDAASSSIKLE